MASQFDYQKASPEEIAPHLNTLHRQAYFRLIDYYTKKGDEAMLSKLVQANKLSKILSLQAEYVQEYGA